MAKTPLSPAQRSQVDRLLRLHDALTSEIGQMDEEVKRLRAIIP